MNGRLALLAIKPQPAVVSYLNFCQQSVCIRLVKATVMLKV